MLAAVKTKRTRAADRVNIPVAIANPATISSAAPAIASACANGIPDVASTEAATPAIGSGNGDNLEAIIVALPSTSINLKTPDTTKVITSAMRPAANTTVRSPDACLKLLETGE